MVLHNQGTSGPTRRGILAAGLLGAAATALGACTRTTGVGGSQSLPAGDDLVFGASLELTGSGAVAGTAQQRALKIAMDTLNTNGITVGNTLRRVQVIVKDNRSDPLAAAGIAQEFIANKVAGIIGGALASTSIAMADVVEPHGVPMLATCAADSVIRPAGSRRFIFKLGPNAVDVAQLMRDAFNRDSGNAVAASRIAILAQANDHGEAGLDAIRQIAGQDGRKIVAVERLADGAPDYLAQATRIAAATPDAVVIWAVSPISGMAARALRTARYNRKLLFDSGAASDDSLTPDNRAAMADSYLVGPQILGGSPVAVNTPNGVAQRDFFDRYSRAYGGFSCLGVYAADGMNLLAQAASRTGSTVPLRLRNELEASPFDGLAGAYAFSTANHGGMQAGGLGLFSLERNGGWLLLS